MFFTILTVGRSKTVSQIDLFDSTVPEEAFLNHFEIQPQQRRLDHLRKQFFLRDNSKKSLSMESENVYLGGIVFDLFKFCYLNLKMILTFKRQ